MSPNSLGLILKIRDSNQQIEESIAHLFHLLKTYLKNN